MDPDVVQNLNPNVVIYDYTKPQIEISKSPTETTIQITRQNPYQPVVTSLPAAVQQVYVPPNIQQPYVQSQNVQFQPVNQMYPQNYPEYYTQPAPKTEPQKFTKTPILSFIKEPFVTLAGGLKTQLGNKEPEAEVLTLSQPVGPGNYPPVIVAHKPMEDDDDDGPGFWTIMLWIILLLAIVILIWWVVSKIKQHKDENCSESKSNSSHEYSSSANYSSDDGPECNCGSYLYENPCNYPHAPKEVTYISSSCSNLKYESVHVESSNLYYTSEGEIDEDSCLAQCEDNPSCKGVVYTESGCDLIMSDVEVNSGTAIVYNSGQGYGVYIYDPDQVKCYDKVYVYKNQKPNNYHTCKCNKDYDDLKKNHVEYIKFIPTNVINAGKLKGVYSTKSFDADEFDELSHCKNKNVYVDNGKCNTMEYHIEFPSCFYKHSHLYVMYK